jgi:hypothetical protein
MAGVTIEVRLFVDLHGAVVPDSTRISPALTLPRYDRDFRTAMARTEYWPAVVEGCAVPAWSTARVTLAR